MPSTPELLHLVEVAKIVSPSRAVLNPLRTIPASSLRVYQSTLTDEWFLLQGFGAGVDNPRIPYSLAEFHARTQDFGDIVAILSGWSKYVPQCEIEAAIQAAIKPAPTVV